MNQREHIRIQIPMSVELTHPSVGTRQATARDISAGGIFVQLPQTNIRQGAKIKVRILNLLDAEYQPTPTVDMEVKRITDEGLGCAFVNKTAEHLWHSALRVRNELEIGRDYFQVHQSLALLNPRKGILLVLQNGKWRLPGNYLLVGESAADALRSYAKKELGMDEITQLTPESVDSSPEISVPEAATLSITFSALTEKQSVRLPKNSPYKNSRWVRKSRDIDEITLVSETQRQTARQTLKRLENGHPD